MSEDLPNSLKLKIYRRLLERAMQQAQQLQSNQEREDAEKAVLSRLADDRAVELMEKLKLKYPEIYKALVQELYKAIRNNIINSIDGLLVYNIINKLGLDIKPEIKLKFVKHGKEVDLRTYLG